MNRIVITNNKEEMEIESMTPIEKIDLQNFNNSLYIKREDLLPFSFGGNKVRIAQEFIRDMKEKGKTCVIGYGNARSNLSRALANLCYSESIPCWIVSPSDDDGNRMNTYNSILAQKCNVQFVACEKTKVSETIESVMKECETLGYVPYYIYGDKFGNGNESTPLYAYLKVYSEIIKQSEKIKTKFDYIFLATGTGMTQSGLLLGKKEYGGDEKIIGISIARSTEKATAIIRNNLNLFCRNGFDLNSEDCEIIVDDTYLCGGYGLYNNKIEKTITNIYTKFGIPLDPTYTGKAFMGTIEYLKKHKITGKNILFIHTGGTPLFFDFFHEEKQSNYMVSGCPSKEKLFEFVQKVDLLLPTPLSERVDISKYIEKVSENGTVLTIIDNEEIVAAILFYCNNSDTKSAYISLIGVLPEYQKKGLSRQLMKEAEKVSASNGMKFIRLETDYSNLKAISLYFKTGYSIEYIDKKLHFVKEVRP